MTDFNIADLFERVADVIPDREAVVCGELRLTYRELDERATRLANALVERGVAAGDHIGLYLHNGNEYLEGMLAAFKMRAVPINVNYRYVADELRYLFNDADLKAVIHEEAFASVIADIRSETPQLALTIARGSEYEALIAAGSAERDFESRSGDDLYVLYTGGTTGMPKGVMWRQDDIFVAAFGGGAVNSIEEVADRVVNGRTRCLPACPFMHGTAHWMAFSTFFGGGTVVISPDAHMDPASIWQLVADEKVSFLVIVGDAFARPLVEALGPGDGPQEQWDLSALGAILSGGAILSPAVKDLLLRRLPGVIVVDGYGASETGGQGQMVAAAGASAGARPRFQVGADTQVIDDDLRPIAPGSGEVGRVARRGRVPLGYYKDPEKSAATFPEINGERWSVPGDLGIVEADGSITLLGRGSVSINTGGEKVFPEEVESCLKAHPAVFDAVVVGIADDRWGQRVTAVVALREGADQPSDEELADHCRSSIAGYKVPRSVVVVPEIVRSPSGKPDYRWAKERAEKLLL